MSFNHLIESCRDNIYSLFKYHDRFTTREGLLVYFNQRIAMFLLLIWALCCLLIVASSKSHTQNNSYLVCLIAFIDVVFINFNYKQFEKYFRFTQTAEAGDEVTLKLCYVCAPLIQLAIIAEALIQFKASKPKHAKLEKYEEFFF